MGKISVLVEQGLMDRTRDLAKTNAKVRMLFYSVVLYCESTVEFLCKHDLRNLNAHGLHISTPITVTYGLFSLSLHNVVLTSAKTDC